ncbi:hypothetical protein [Exiguobacterium sp. s183]|uniref:hypothetical protein n=1 Tax=Exiguobacterium sp. s183 TaxID=2751262 RepID=UPI001BE59367|nr:hypothetical protein [Exiguobacterium sp. s183]
MKNRNLINFSILVLLMALMVINNIEGLYTFKTLMNSFAILTLSVIGVVYATNYVKRKKQAM